MEKVYYFCIKDKQKGLVLQGIVALVYKHIDFSNVATTPLVELLKVSIRQLFYKMKRYSGKDFYANCIKKANVLSILLFKNI